MSSITFGRTEDGLKASLFELHNNNGMRVFITNYGGTITQLWAPDADGDLANIVLGFDNLRQYQTESPNFRGLIGRHANRITNGARAFHKRLWDVRSANSGSLILELHSYEMEEGDPGNLSVIVGYHLNDHNELCIIYNAQSDRRTPCDLTNHTYFNLAGAGRNSILNHRLRLHADQFHSLGEDPGQGAVRSVSGTAMDFRQFRSIESGIAEVQAGYDHAWLRHPGYGIVAEACEPGSSRTLTMYSTQPSVRFHSGDFFDGSVHGNGGTYNKHAGFCLAAQLYPNSLNRPDFPCTILNPGDLYTQTTVYKFGIAC